jgi:coenzyme F420-reducing hydrogenase delta subunit
VARRKFAMLKSFLDYLGIEPQRVQFSWVSASEGARFASLIEKVVGDIQKLKTPNKLVKQLCKTVK